jgi:hypothetical protein
MDRRHTTGGIGGDEAKSNGAGKAPQPVSKRARALLRQLLKHGARPGAQIEAAAKAAAIPESALIAAATGLGVRTRKGQWWLPG